jgi:hypothetical protein
MAKVEWHQGELYPRCARSWSRSDPGRAPWTHGVFQLAEGALPQALFAEIMRRIDRLRPEPGLRR